MPSNVSFDCRPHESETDAKALEELKNVDWTGNIRELRNIVERLVTLCEKIITAADIKMYANPKA